jgi:hypothetical protein
MEKMPSVDPEADVAEDEIMDRRGFRGVGRHTPRDIGVLKGTSKN